MKKVYLVFPAILLLVITGLYFTTPASAIVWQNIAKSDEDNAFLGITIGEIDLDGNDIEGAYIFGVAPDSPAEKAGLEKGDIVIAIDGKHVKHPDNLKEIINQHKPGDEITLTVKRGDEEKVLKATLSEQEFAFWFSDGEHKSDFSKGKIRVHPQIFKSHTLNAFGMNRYYLGIEYRELNEDLARYFKSSDTKGVLVLEVEKDSPAYEAGIKAGDVILAVDERKVVDSSDLLNALKIRNKKTESFNIRLMREGSEMDLVVKAKTHEKMFHVKPGELVLPDEPRLRSWKSDDGEHAIIIRSRDSNANFNITKEDGDKNILILDDLAEIDLEPNTTKSIVIVGDGQKTKLMIHDDGTVTLNERKFESVEEFKKFLESDEGQAFSRKINGNVKNRIKIKLNKSIISI